MTMFTAISVIGSGTCSAKHAKLAEEVGFLLGSRKVIVICGGRGGVMEAVSKGVHKAGGLTIGILPGMDANAGNKYLSLAIPTGLGQARNAIIAYAGQAVIAIGGSYGTLSEISLARKAGRRVIGLETWHAEEADGSLLDIEYAKDPEEAVRKSLGAPSSSGKESRTQ